MSGPLILYLTTMFFFRYSMGSTSNTKSLPRHYAMQGLKLSLPGSSGMAYSPTATTNNNNNSFSGDSSDYSAAGASVAARDHHYSSRPPSTGGRRRPRTPNWIGAAGGPPKSPVDVGYARTIPRYENNWQATISPLSD